jgi:hypothetical protein
VHRDPPNVITGKFNLARVTTCPDFHPEFADR